MLRTLYFVELTEIVSGENRRAFERVAINTSENGKMSSNGLENDISQQNPQQAVNEPSAISQPGFDAVQQDSTPLQNVKGLPRGKPFVKGDPRIRQFMDRDKAAGDEQAQAPAAEPEIALMTGINGKLADMQHVYNRPAKDDRTEGQKKCRAWWNDDRKGFMTHMSALEAKYLARQEKPDPQSWDRTQPCPTCGQVIDTKQEEESLARLRKLIEDGYRPGLD
jgi:hypothetical protein